MVGPNGAGKTTCFNVISGTLKADAGRVLLDGRAITGLPLHRIGQLGIGRTFQNVRLFPNMTVLENVMAGCHRLTKAGFLAGALGLAGSLKEENWARERAREALVLVGLESKESQLAAGLPLGEEKLLEIARALAMDPVLLMLDEPAAGLNDVETVALAKLLKKLCESGRTILLVEHNMGLVMGVSDRVIVLNYGEKIADGTPREVQADHGVVAAYLGGTMATC